MASVIKHWAGCRHLEKLGGSHEKQVACLKLEAKVCNLLSLFQRVKHLGLFDGGAWHRRRPRWETEYTRSKFKPKVTPARTILTPFLSLVCILQCGEIQGETGQTRKVPWRRRGLVKKDLKKGNLHPWWCYTWFLVLDHHSIQLSGIPTALTSLAILFTGWGKGLEVCRYYWFWWW